MHQVNQQHLFEIFDQCAQRQIVSETVSRKSQDVWRSAGKR
jgi:hypothetical protein